MKDYISMFFEFSCGLLLVLNWHHYRMMKSWKEHSTWQQTRQDYWYKCYMAGKLLPDPDFANDFVPPSRMKSEFDKKLKTEK